MKRWGMAILVVVLVAIAAAASAMPAAAQEQEVTLIAPGGNYHVYVTVNKPDDMSLSTKWEIRFYFYSDVSCFNQGEWVDFGGGTYLYDGYWEPRVRNESWSTPNEKIWDKWISVVNHPRGSEGPAYPPALTEDQFVSAGGTVMDNLPIGQTITLRARFIFRELSPTFEGQYVAFKIAGTSYRYKFEKDSYDRYWLKNEDGTDVGSGGYIDQTEGTGEWRLNYRADKDLMVNENAATTGKITIGSTITLGLSPSRSAIPIELVLAGGIILVVVIAIVFIMRRRKGEEIPPVPEFAPPPPPEAPPPTGSATATS